MNVLRPIHPSVRPRMIRTPNNMDRMKIPQEMHDGMLNIALSIFTDACNVGVPFQDAIAAVYMSGIEHGMYAQREIAIED